MNNKFLTKSNQNIMKKQLDCRKYEILIVNLDTL